MKFTVIIFAFVFGILSLAPNMQGGQFLKLDEVVEHYEHHQSNEESFSSFISFVRDHYFSNHNTNENERHLPFKSSTVSVPVMVSHECSLQFVELAVYFEVQTKDCFGEPHGLIQDNPLTVWNPPKMC